MKLDGDLFAVARRKGLLMTAVIELTYRCDLACEVCYNDRSRSRKPLTIDEHVALFEELADLQVLNLVFTGGEPSLHPRFLELGRHARRLGFALRIKTNGMRMDRTMAEILRREVDPFVIDVSLHGATAVTHDRQTRKRGSFDRIVRNLVSMKEEGLRVRLSGLLTSWNEHELEAMQALADRLEMDIIFDCSPTPRDDGDRSPMVLAPSPDAVRRVLELQLDRHGPPQVKASESGTREQSGPFDGSVCSAGYSTMAVDPYGDVLPCVNWRRPVGNIGDQSIREIWQSTGELRRVRELNSQALRVLTRHELEAGLMGFCPGLAHSISGNELEIYPSALQRAQLQLEVMDRSRAPDPAKRPERDQNRPAP